MRQQNDKHIENTASFIREINRLKDEMQRENNIKNRLEIQLKQLQNEIEFTIETKDNIISQMRDMLMNQKKQTAILHNKLIKIKRERNIITEDAEIGIQSKALKNVFIKTEKNQKSGDTIITLEKQNDTDNTDDDADDENNPQTEDKKQVSARKYDQSQELKKLQQKIEWLQQEIEIKDENFFKQNQLLQFKFKQKETETQKLIEYLDGLRIAHKMETNSLNDRIEEQKHDLGEKNIQIQSLAQNLDMMEQQNVILKENDEIIEDYEAQIEELEQSLQRTNEISSTIELTNQLKQSQNEINVLKHQLKNAEDDKIKLYITII
eukprot:14939_1